MECGIKKQQSCLDRQKNTAQIHWIVEYFKKSNIELWFINNNEDIDYKYYSCLILLDLWQEDYFIPKIGSKDYFLEKNEKILVSTKI